jgi:hypothetical protein
MSNVKTPAMKNPEKSNAACQCGTCSCGCPKNACHCQETNCRCGCQATSESRELPRKAPESLVIRRRRGRFPDSRTGRDDLRDQELIQAGSRTGALRTGIVVGL